MVVTAAPQPVPTEPGERPVRLREVTAVASFQCACPECGQYFPSSHALSVHIGKQHAGTRPSKAKSTREKQVRCEEYRQHSVHGMPQCRHCNRRFYGWLQFRGHFSQQACPILHYQAHAVHRGPTLPSTNPTPLDPAAPSAVHFEAPPAYGAFAPGGGSTVPTQQPDVPLFDRPELQQLAKRRSVKELAAAIRASGSLQHCPLCFQWMTKASYVARHACTMHPALAAVQTRVVEWAQSKPPPLCPCNWCGVRFRGPAVVHRKSCVVLWMCGHFLSRFDTLDDPGQTKLDGYSRSESSRPQGSGGGVGTLRGVHESRGGSADSADHHTEHGPLVPGERGAACRSELGAPPDGSGSGKTPSGSPARAGGSEVAQGAFQGRPQGGGSSGSKGARQKPRVGPNRQRPSCLPTQTLAAAFRAGAVGATRSSQPATAAELVEPTATPHERQGRPELTPSLARPGPGPRSGFGGPTGPGGSVGALDVAHRRQPQRLQPRHQLHAVPSNEGVGEGLDGYQGALRCSTGVESTESRRRLEPLATDEDGASALSPHRVEDPPPQYGVGHSNVSQGQGDGPDGWHALPVLEVEPEGTSLRARRAGTLGSREGCGDSGVLDPAHGLPRYDRQVPPPAEAHSDDGERGHSLLAPDSEPYSGGTPDVLFDAQIMPERLPPPGGCHGSAHPPRPESTGNACRTAPAVDSALKPTEAQVAGLVLRNPSTHCYANSAILALLWVAARLPRGLQVQRHFSRLMRWLLRKPLHAALWHIPAWICSRKAGLSPIANTMQPTSCIF